jgi:spermidine dehydrogenase
MTRKRVRSSAGNRSNLGLDARISRRDFVNGVLLGSAAALAGAGTAAAQGLDPGWDGYGGSGDYWRAHGNTGPVVDSAHRIRDGAYDGKALAAEDTGERFDLVVVGAGFAGIVGAYEFQQQTAGGRTCLILDNHAVFGGEAKQNEFLVDGYRLFAPQGSNGFVVPRKEWGRFWTYWQDLRLPMRYEFEDAAGAAAGLRVTTDSFGPMYWDEPSAVTGYFVRSRDGNLACIKGAVGDGVAQLPWPESLQRDLVRLRHSTRNYADGHDEVPWLDGMSYATFLEQVMGLDRRVKDIWDPIVAVGGFGACSDVISAYAVKRNLFPGVTPYKGPGSVQGMDVLGFPGGNSTLIRHFVKALIPEAIEGELAFADVTLNSIRFGALDQPGQSTRMRLEATVVRVENARDQGQDCVRVTYERGGRLFRVQAGAAIVASGSWVTRRIVRDLPAAHAAAHGQVHHGPILSVNVALRNWRFMARLGISAATWFDGFGFHANIRRPMKIPGLTTTLDPDHPVVLTYYVPFLTPGLPIQQQVAASRAKLYAASFRDLEHQVRLGLTEMFGPAGFDARRDVAAIILNRWGHAYVSPQPGFFTAPPGGKTLMQTLREPVGRVFFAHSEMQGNMNWHGAAMEGRRAAEEASGALRA